MLTALDARLVPLDLLHPSDDNPRTDLDVDAEFVASIRDHGILEPLIVRPADGYDGTEDRPHFEIIAGHRRFAGALAANLDDVPVMVRTDLAGVSVRVARILENVHRTDLSVLDEARAYAALKAEGMKQGEIAASVARNQAHVSKRLTLLHLTEGAQALLVAGRLTVNEAVELARTTAIVQDAAVAKIERGASPSIAVSAATGQQADLAARKEAIKNAKDDDSVVIANTDDDLRAKTEGTVALSAAAPSTVRAHRADPLPACHLVVIGPRKSYDPIAQASVWEVGYCSLGHAGHVDDPAAPDGPSGAAPTAVDPGTGRTYPTTEDPAQKAEREARVAAQNARLTAINEAQATRLAFLRDLLSAKKLPNNTVDHLLRGAAYVLTSDGDLVDEADAPVVHELTGTPYDAAVERPATDAPSTDLVRWHLAVRFGCDEDDLRTLVRDRVGNGVDPAVATWRYGNAVRHLAYLVAAGYTPADVEAAAVNGLTPDGTVIAVDDVGAVTAADEIPGQTDVVVEAAAADDAPVVVPDDATLANMNRPDLVDLCKSLTLPTSPKTTMKAMRLALAEARDRDVVA